MGLHTSNCSCTTICLPSHPKKATDQAIFFLPYRLFLHHLRNLLCVLLLLLLLFNCPWNKKKENWIRSFFVVLILETSGRNIHGPSIHPTRHPCLKNAQCVVYSTVPTRSFYLNVRMLLTVLLFPQVIFAALLPHHPHRPEGGRGKGKNGTD